jgi:hypothetical protein
MKVQPSLHFRVSISGGAGNADSISRWTEYAQIFIKNAKLLCANHLHEVRQRAIGLVMVMTADAGIVSLAALPYTGRERNASHLNREGAHYCQQKPCVSQTEEA